MTSRTAAHAFRPEPALMRADHLAAFTAVFEVGRRWGLWHLQRIAAAAERRECRKSYKDRPACVVSGPLVDAVGVWSSLRVEAVREEGAAFALVSRSQGAACRTSVKTAKDAGTGNTSR